MLSHFTFLDLFSERCTVASAVAASTPDLLCSLCHGVDVTKWWKAESNSSLLRRGVTALSNPSPHCRNSLMHDSKKFRARLFNPLQLATKAPEREYKAIVTAKTIAHRRTPVRIAAGGRPGAVTRWKRYILYLQGRCYIESVSICLGEHRWLSLNSNSLLQTAFTSSSSQLLSCVFSCKLRHLYPIC